MALAKLSAICKSKPQAIFVTVKGPTSERQDSGLKHKDPKLNEPLHSQTFRKLVQRIENLRKEQFGYLSDQYAIQFKNENI